MEGRGWEVIEAVEGRGETGVVGGGSLLASGEADVLL